MTAANFAITGFGLASRAGLPSALFDYPLVWSPGSAYSPSAPRVPRLASEVQQGRSCCFLRGLVAGVCKDSSY